jgi:hypothetical protein
VLFEDAADAADAGVRVEANDDTESCGVTPVVA